MSLAQVHVRKYELNNASARLVSPEAIEAASESAADAVA